LPITALVISPCGDSIGAAMRHLPSCADAGETENARQATSAPAFSHIILSRIVSSKLS
jgi:hypothetical protein